MLYLYLIINLSYKMGDLLKDLFCGWCSGIGQVLTMMPFQNIKIKLVSKPDQYFNIAQAATKTIREEGVMSFYKGMLMNLLGVGPQVALQFGTAETLKKYFKKKYTKENEDLPIKFIYLSGLIAGVPSAMVVTPLDHARFRVALRKEGKMIGSFQMSRQIIQQYGLRKLYLGYITTNIRESFAMATYFCTYEICKRKMLSDAKNPPIWAILLAGGFSGITTWTATYPLDYIKTLIQTDNLDNPRHKSPMGYLRQTLAKGSIKQFFVGFDIMIIRAFFVNAAGFLCFQAGKKLVYKQQQR